MKFKIVGMFSLCTIFFGTGTVFAKDYFCPSINTITKAQEKAGMQGQFELKDQDLDFSVTNMRGTIQKLVHISGDAAQNNKFVYYCSYSTTTGEEVTVRALINNPQCSIQDPGQGQGRGGITYSFACNNPFKCPVVCQ